MPENPKTLRVARKYLATLDADEAQECLEQMRLSPAEERFLFFGDDPVGFIWNYFKWDIEDGEGPKPYQEDYIRHLVTEKKVAVRGPHGLGKTAGASWVTWWFAWTRDGVVDWKAVTTAGGQRQLEKYFWPEVRKWAGRLRWDMLQRKPFEGKKELMMQQLRLSTGEAFAAASDNPELIEGAHAKHLLYIFDESKRVPGGTFDAAEGAFSNAGPETSNEAYALAISTPGEPVGRFADIHFRRPGLSDWWPRHVTLDEVVAANVVSYEWAENRALQWGRDSATFKNRVLGEFASSDQSAVIPADWVALAQERWHDLYEVKGDTVLWLEYEDDEDFEPELTAMGVDVAYGGEDDTIHAPRYGNYVKELKRFAFLKDNHKNALNVWNYLQAHNPEAQVIVDVVGWGAGTYDNLKAWGTDAVPFHPQTKSYRKDETGELGFKDRRSAAWWHLRDILNPASGYDVALPPDDMLVGDLTAPTWRALTGKIEVEQKDKLRERLGRSPDAGDAVVMSFWNEGEGEPIPIRAVSLGKRPRRRQRRKGKRPIVR